MGIFSSTLDLKMAKYFMDMMESEDFYGNVITYKITAME